MDQVFNSGQGLGVVDSEINIEELLLTNWFGISQAKANQLLLSGILNL